MKFYNRYQSLLLTLSAIASATVMSIPQAQAVSFAEQQMRQDHFTVVAVPFGYQEHRLEIIEQIEGEQQCWNESGAAPVTVDLLLLDFDHTNSCRRIINTNGYTLRLNGEDDRVAHVVKIVQDQGELKLMAFHKDPSQPSIEIGSTNGLRDGAMKIILNPGWQISKRVHQGETIDHLYLSGNINRVNNIYPSNIPSTEANPGNNQGTVNSTQIPNIDTKVLVNSVEQIYNNVVTPLLHNLSQENPNNQ